MKYSTMKKILTQAFLVLLFSASLTAQDFSFGFKAGLNFNSFISDSELDSQGNEVEDFTGNAGFHVGAIFGVPFTDLMGMRAEFMFTQKGGRYVFEGESYYTFLPENSGPITSTGIRKMNLNITNSYIEVPLIFYYRPLKAIEVSVGLAGSLSVGSTSFGEFRYEGTTPSGEFVESFPYSLEYNYYKDKPRGGNNGFQLQGIEVGGKTVIIPLHAGAYYEFTEDRGDLHKRFDVSGVAGVSLYLSSGLYLGFRANIGLTDFTNNETDVSKVSLNNGEFIPLEIKDRLLSLQTSLGFSF